MRVARWWYGTKRWGRAIAYQARGNKYQKACSDKSVISCSASNATRKKLLIVKSTDANGTGTSSALHLAAAHGNVAACKALLDQGEDVNIRTPSGRTPLMSASLAGKADTVSLLLRMGALKALMTKGISSFKPNVACVLRYESSGYIRCNRATRKAMEGLSEEDKLVVMFRAASHNYPDELRMLLSHGVRPDFVIQWKGGVLAPLHVAAASGHATTCKALLDHGADVNIRTPSGRTPLMSASQVGRADVVALLLQKGAVKGLCAKLFSFSTTGKMMLRYGSGGYIRGNKATRKAMEGLSEEDKLAVMFRAAYRNFPDELEILLSLGIRPDVMKQWMGGSQVSPLHVAASSGHMAACKTLLDHGADVNIRTPFGRNPLISAKAAAYRRLLGHGADDIKTPLMSASQAVVALIQKTLGNSRRKRKRPPLCVNVRTPSGRTPLMTAAQAGRADVMAHLLQKGALKGLLSFSAPSGKMMLRYGSGGYIRGNKATLKAMEGLSEEDKLVVMFRAAFRNFPDELEMLLSLGVCPDFLRKWKGRGGIQVSPLHVAASAGHMAACKILLDHGADVNIKTPSGRTPLMSASRAGRADVVALLQKGTKGIPVLKKTKSSKAEDLQLAARVGDSTLCGLLVKGGSDPNRLFKSGNARVSPLHIAASSGHIAACRTLLDHGADVNIRTPSGRTPLMSASEAGRADVVSLLLTKGAVKGLTARVSCYQRHSEVSGMLRYGSSGYIRGNEATRKAMEGLSEEDKLAVTIEAAYSNYPDELEILLSLGVS